jgi:hypothetical protein
MDVMGVESDRGGIEAVLAAESIEATNIRGEELGENVLPTRLRGQDVDLGDNSWGAALLGEIVQRFGNDLWRETRNRHQDLSKPNHLRSPSCWQALHTICGKADACYGPSEGGYTLAMYHGEMTYVK